MLDWVLNISLSIALNSLKERNFSDMQQTPIMSLRRPLKVLKERLWEVGLGCTGEVRLRHPEDVRWERPRDGQMGCLGEFLGTLDGDVLWTSWRSIWIKCYFYLHGKFSKEHLSVAISGFLKAFRDSHSSSKVYMRIYVLIETMELKLTLWQRCKFPNFSTTSTLVS